MTKKDFDEMLEEFQIAWNVEEKSVEERLEALEDLTSVLTYIIRELLG